MKKCSKDSCNSFLLWHFLAFIFRWFFIIFVLSSFDDDHESDNSHYKAKHSNYWKNHNTLRTFLWWFLFFQFFLFELFKRKRLAIMRFPDENFKFTQVRVVRIARCPNSRVQPRWKSSKIRFILSIWNRFILDDSLWSLFSSIWIPKISLEHACI